MGTKKSESSTESQADTQKTEAPASENKMDIKPPPQESTVNEVEWTGQRPNVTPTVTGESAQEPDKATPEAAVKTLTQAELDAIIQSRIAQERKKYADYDDVKAELQRRQDAEKTEQEKTQERVKELETKIATLAESERQKAIDNQLLSAASKVNLPLDAALKLVDRDAIETDGAGTVTNADALVKSIAEAYPGLIKRAAPAAPTVNGSRSEQAPGPSDDELRRKYFGSGGGNFWTTGSVLMPDEES